ncbi:MAG TPA: chaplin, partial [Candidatus Nocardiopsis merdipullorum]|nr:chaplin [Candidatus Nocardiopsis merdipullorum]
TFRYSFATVLTAGLVTTPLTAVFAETDGSGGVASGNQIVVPVDAAVDICGNAVSVLGITEAGCMETISEGSEDDEDEGQEDNDNGEEDEDEGHEDDNGDDKGDEEDSGKGDEGDDKPAPSADGELPVTGGALSGLVAAALAAVGAGGTGLYFARKRKAATDE